MDVQAAWQAWCWPGFWRAMHWNDGTYPLYENPWVPLSLCIITARSVPTSVYVASMHAIGGWGMQKPAFAGSMSIVDRFQEVAEGDHNWIASPCNVM